MSKFAQRFFLGIIYHRRIMGFGARIDDERLLHISCFYQKLGGLFAGMDYKRMVVGVSHGLGGVPWIMQELLGCRIWVAGFLGLFLF